MTLGISSSTEKFFQKWKCISDFKQLKLYFNHIVKDSLLFNDKTNRHGVMYFVSESLKYKWCVDDEQINYMT